MKNIRTYKEFLNESKLTNKDTLNLLDKINKDLGYEAFKMDSESAAEPTDTGFKLTYSDEPGTVRYNIGWGNTWMAGIIQINVFKQLEKRFNIKKLLKKYKNVRVDLAMD